MQDAPPVEAQLGKNKKGVTDPRVGRRARHRVEQLANQSMNAHHAMVPVTHSMRL
jgi:hypothetical protein